MKRPFFLFCLCILNLTLSGQVEYEGKPRSLGLNLKSAPVSINFPGLTRAAQEAYVEGFSPQLKKMLFAFPYDTLLSSERTGSWETLGDGSRIWRLSVYSPGARSINLIFSRFDIPENARMFLYTPDYSVIRGAFTRKNRIPSGVLATVPVPGDRIIIELDVPEQSDIAPVLEISRVSHDFKGFFGDQGIENTDCNIDVNCPPGASWQTEKRAVVKFIRGGVWLCSGALINNTANNGRPLLLSANHTIGSQTHAEQSVFFFRFERPTCASGNGTSQYSMSGANLLATTGKVDFSLVELSSAPPKSYEPFYAGWDRRVFPYLDTVTCIHHPNGSVKKISRSYSRVVTADFGGGYDSNTHWKVAAWDLGTTEPGSSGSPLFNSDHRIVGDLTGGDASCSYNFNDYFEKFSVSWDRYPDSASQLKHWLDPQGTGASVLNGFDPYSGGKPVANFHVRPDRIEAGKKVFFADLSTGDPVSWKWTFENGTPATSTQKVPPFVKFNQPGTYRISLIVSNALGSDSLTQTVNVSGSSGYALSENRIVQGRRVELADKSTGFPVMIYWSVPGADTPAFTGELFGLSFASPGEYTVTESLVGPAYSDTLIHYNQIKVIPEVIAYKSTTYSNVEADEHAIYHSVAGQGYLPGSNSQQVTAFAEAFRNKTDTTFIINGITIPLAMRSSWAKGYYLPVVVWNAKKQVIMRDSVLISNFEENSRFTKWFKSPVNFDTLIYAGFEIKPWDKGTFVSLMATDRGENGLSTAYVIKDNQWSAVTDYAGLHTSFDFGLETSLLMDAYEKQIRIVPNYNDGIFTIDLGKLVFNKVDLTVFNMRGQQITPEISRSENSISFRIYPPVPGVYALRLVVDNYRFSTKVMVVRH